VTIAEALKPAGYATYAVGKWHVTKHIQPEGPKFNWPLQRGFDRFYGTITGAGSFYDPGTLTRDNTMISPFADAEYQPEQYYYTNAISDHAIRFIKEHKEQQADKPFFMYVAYTCAHWPMHALEKDIAKYQGKYGEGYAAYRQARLERMRKLGLIGSDWELSPRKGNWEKVEHKEWEARCMEVYAAMIDNMDQNIGRIVSTLKARGDYENTLILFLQDNGGCQEGNGRGGDWNRPVAATLPPIANNVIRLDVVPKQNRAGVPTLMGPNVMPGPEDTYIAYGINWANVSNTPFREYKHFVHEGGISTPLIAHWPQGIARKGELEPQPGHLIDLMATCVDVSGAKYPETRNGEMIQSMEGVSLQPAFGGGSLHRKQPIFWEHEGNRAIRDGEWKLVAQENKPWELYNMQSDRTEMHNLSAKDPQRVAKMAEQWDDYAKRAAVLPLGAWSGKPKRK
jgi:arylsulfatase